MVCFPKTSILCGTEKWSTRTAADKPPATTPPFLPFLRESSELFNKFCVCTSVAIVF